MSDETWDLERRDNAQYGFKSEAGTRLRSVGGIPLWPSAMEVPLSSDARTVASLCDSRALRLGIPFGVIAEYLAQDPIRPDRTVNVGWRASLTISETLVLDGCCSHERTVNGLSHHFQGATHRRLGRKSYVGVGSNLVILGALFCRAREGGNAPFFVDDTSGGAGWS